MEDVNFVEELTFVSSKVADVKCFDRLDNPGHFCPAITLSVHVDPGSSKFKNGQGCGARGRQ